MRSDDAYLLDILEAARLALEYVHEATLEQFRRNVQLQDSVIRRLEIIGEAARSVSLQERRNLPDLPWQAMIGMRNVLIHRYDSVDLDVVWDTVVYHLPRVVATLESIVPPADA
jgi:uncharacterized protein with HEPN domain